MVYYEIGKGNERGEAGWDVAIMYLYSRERGHHVGVLCLASVRLAHEG